MIPLYIVRHGETKLNNDTDTSQDRIRGWTDVPLTDKGRQEAKIAGEKLKKHKIEVICCSPLSRAHETAKIIGKELNIKPVTIDGLKPWNLGELTGTSTKEALPKIAEYVRKKADKKVPEGESFNDFSNRAFEGFKEAIKKADGKTLCVVTHHRDERLIRAWVKAGCPADHHIDLDLFLQKGDPPGGVIALKIDEENLGAEGETDSADSSDDNEEDAENKVEENDDNEDEGKEEEKPVIQAKKGAKPVSFGADKLGDVASKLKQPKEPKEPKQQHHMTIIHIGPPPSSPMLSALFGKNDRSS